MKLGCGVVIDHLQTEPCGCGRDAVDTLRRSGGELVEAVPLADIGVAGGWGEDTTRWTPSSFSSCLPLIMHAFLQDGAIDGKSDILNMTNSPSIYPWAGIVHPIPDISHPMPMTLLSTRD